MILLDSCCRSVQAGCDVSSCLCCNSWSETLLIGDCTAAQLCMGWIFQVLKSIIVCTSGPAILSLLLSHVCCLAGLIPSPNIYSSSLSCPTNPCAVTGLHMHSTYLVLCSFWDMVPQYSWQHRVPTTPLFAVQQIMSASPYLRNLELHMFKTGLHCRNLKHSFDFPLSGKPRLVGVFLLTVC